MISANFSGAVQKIRNARRVGGFKPFLLPSVTKKVWGVGGLNNSALRNAHEKHTQAKLNFLVFCTTFV